MEVIVYEVFFLGYLVLFTKLIHLLLVFLIVPPKPLRNLKYPSQKAQQSEELALLVNVSKKLKKNPS